MSCPSTGRCSGRLVLHSSVAYAHELGLLNGDFVPLERFPSSSRYVAVEMAVMYAGGIVKWGDSGAVVDASQHPHTRLLLSAVPDPARLFQGNTSRLDAGLVAQARDAARLTGGILQVAGNHHGRAA
jgi:hypothetical protein